MRRGLAIKVDFGFNAVQWAVFVLGNGAQDDVLYYFTRAGATAFFAGCDHLFDVAVDGELA